MTRIIAGDAGGRRIAVPGGTTTRPTSDRVREAVFSAVGSLFGDLEGLRVLDVGAGSGAIGLEALSRGAAHASFIESEPAVARTLRANVATLGYADRTDVVTKPAGTVLGAGLPPGSAGYDLVYVDPPYDLDTTEVDAWLRSLADEGWCTQAVVIVVERRKRSAAPTWPAGFEQMRTKKYGETVLWYGQRALPDEE